MKSLKNQQKRTEIAAEFNQSVEITRKNSINRKRVCVFERERECVCEQGVGQY